MATKQLKEPKLEELKSVERASKETAEQAATAMSTIISAMTVPQRVAMAQETRMVSSFIMTARAKLPSEAAYARDRLRKRGK